MVNSKEYHQKDSMIIYGYSIFDYARKYDLDFRNVVNAMQLIYQEYLNQQFILRMKRPCCHTDIPHEGFLEIFSYLDAASLLAAAQVCKYWTSLTCEPFFWDHLLFNDFNITSNHVKTNFESSREFVYDQINSQDHLCYPLSRKIYRSLYENFHLLRRSRALMPAVLHLPRSSLSSMPSLSIPI